jgi:hypothetical protein
MPLLSAIPSVAKIFGGGAKGAADERTLKNQFTTGQNTAETARYGTAQNALMQSLLARGQEDTSRYGTKQGATTGAMQGLQGATSRALEAQSGEGLERAKLGMAAPSIQAKQSILGSLMKNMQPHEFQSAPRQQGHLTQVRGGMSAANLDPGTRALGGKMIEAALKDPNANIPGATDFMGGIQDWKSTILDQPAATDYSKGLMKPPDLKGYENAGKGESGMSLASIIGGIGGELLPALLAGRGGGGKEPITLSNQMPTPYSGGDASGTMSNFQLPVGRLDDLTDYAGTR